MIKTRKTTIILCLIALLCMFSLLTACDRDGNHMRQQLVELEKANNAVQPMTNDSLAEALVNYFDRHGTSNERMRARYILGRTYFCMGELPRALEMYNEAISCADTTASDCDYAKLSRIHAQCAAIFDQQIQPRSQIKVLQIAEMCARKARDTFMIIESYAQQANAYEQLKKKDSVILVKEKAAEMFKSVGMIADAARTKGLTITYLLDEGKVSKARDIIDDYENYSGLFDSIGNIEKGREIYYYAKGKYYLATNRLDSADFFFRKELKEGTDLNNQIAGCKGLQEVYEQIGNSDSVAKYANLSYELNDSAYSLSEMQNIQKMQASYNYNHNKYLAEKKELEAEKAWLMLIVVVLLASSVVLLFAKKYREFKKAALDYRLRNANITRHLRKLAKSNPIQYPELDDWKELRSLVEREIPLFRKTLNTNEYTLTDIEYDVCLAIRVHILPIEISKLKKCSPSYITNIRKNLLLKIFKREGNADDFDEEIVKIGNKPKHKIASLKIVKSFFRRFLD